jgi:hypothetical protein
LKPANRVPPLTRTSIVFFNLIDFSNQTLRSAQNATSHALGQIMYEKSRVSTVRFDELSQFSLLNWQT